MINTNSNLITIQSNDQISNDGGSALFQLFLQKFGILKLIKEYLPISEDRSYYTFSNGQLLLQMITMIAQGYHEDWIHSKKVDDPVNQLFLSELGSQPTISRFLKRLSETGDEVWNHFLLEFAKLYFKSHSYTKLILDIDSTHFDTYGHQEKTSYNGHYNTNGYHPLIVTELNSGLIISLMMRPGNKYTSTDADKLLCKVLTELSDYQILVRGDSGFATPDIFKLTQTFDFDFIIRSKSYSTLTNAAEHEIDPDYQASDVQYSEIKNYHPNSWDGLNLRVVAESKRQSGELIFDHVGLITTLTEVTPQQLFNAYRNRGSMENIIRELKEGFAFGKTDSHSYQVNQARMFISALTYNLVEVFKRLYLSSTKWANSRINQLRFDLFHIAGKVTKHARKLYLQLSSKYEYYSEWFKIFESLRC